MLVILKEPIGENKSIRLGDNERVVVDGECAYVMRRTDGTEKTIMIILLLNIVAILDNG